MEINNKYVDITNVQADQQGRKKERAIVVRHGTKQVFLFLFLISALRVQVVLGRCKCRYQVWVTLKWMRFFLKKSEKQQIGLGHEEPVV